LVPIKFWSVKYYTIAKFQMHCDPLKGFYWENFQNFHQKNRGKTKFSTFKLHGPSSNLLCVPMSTPTTIIVTTHTKHNMKTP
jgi:hypothetical protein